MTLIRRHALWLLLAAIVGIVGAALIYATRPVAYSSTAQVDVEPHPVTNAAPVAPNMTTETQVATSGIVVTSTARVIGSTASSLQPHLSAKVTGAANVMSIGCTMPTPAAAQHCATAAAAAYIGFRNLASGSASDQAQDPLHATLVTPASLPLAPAGLGEKTLLAAGALLGLLVGLGAVILRDRLDDRVRDRADLERCLDAPVAAEVLHVSRRLGPPASVFTRSPHSPVAEGYRYLRARLDPLIASTEGGVVLLVASARAWEGRTSVAANLATALAYAGDKVILVDADLQHPSLSKVFGTRHRPGLGDLLAGRALLEETAVPTNVPGLRLVAAGEAVGLTSDTLNVSSLGRGFARMKAVADVIVVDSAPVLEVSDALRLACVSDLVVVVADVRRTRRSDASSAAQQIRAVGLGTIVGVLNAVPTALWKRSTQSNVSREGEWVASSPQVPAILGSLVPSRGPNGHGGTLHTAAGASRRGQSDTALGAEDDRRSRDEPKEGE
jgi:capsular exopolysaccharide synthesis family protein